MTTRGRFVLSLALLPLLTMGCAMVASPVGNGSIYTQVRGPVAPGSATSATKSGHACAQNVLGVVAVGDASIETAKKNGGVSNVASVDHDSFSILGLYSKYCTIVTGS